MSLYGALFSGVSGLAAQSSAMGAISDNITNVNTIGYKGAKVNFKTLVTKQVSLTNYAPGGVQSAVRKGIDVQGLLQATNSSTDVSLSGQGFFIVNEAANPQEGDMFAYTRAGSFKVDKEGYLQNVSGWYMQGWPLMGWDNAAQASTVQVGNNTFMKAYKDDTGNTVYINDNIVSQTHLQPLNLNEVGGTAAQTRNLRMGANLPNGADVGKIYKQPVTIYDSLGGDSTVQFSWNKVAQNRWDIEAVPPLGAKSLTLKNSAGLVYGAMGRLDFQGKPKTTGAMTMTVGGTTWTVNTKSGTSGQIANSVYVDPASASSTGAFVSSMATEIDKLMRIQSEGQSNALAPAGANAANFGHGTSLTVTDPATGNTSTFTFDPSAGVAGQLAAAESQIETALGFAAGEFSLSYAAGVFTVTNGHATKQITAQGTGDIWEVSGTLDVVGAAPANADATTAINTYSAGTDILIDSTSPSTTISLDGLTKAEAVYLINQQAGTTGVSAMQNGGNVAFYTPNASTIHITGTTDLAAVNLTLYGTGRTYCERLAGTDSLIFRQYDEGATAADNLVIGGLDTLDLSNGNPATLQGMDPGDATGFTISGISIGNGNGEDAIEFNGDGTPKEINISSFAIDWANGSKDMTGADEIGMFLGNLNIRDGMTQLDGDYQLAYWSQNGAKFGNFAGVSIGADGIVTALFDNGVTRPVFQIPVATFTNPNGMESLSGNVFISTDNSGEPTLRTAGAAGAGQVAAASLEASTVDIGEEFTTMIVTQRAYSAAAKIITTSDEMLDELVRIKR